jgi:hypothetical protein
MEFSFSHSSSFGPGGNVRRFIQWSLVPVAVVALAACGKRDSHSATAMNDDLKRDLKLASQTQSLQINPDEIAPKSHQELAVRPKAAPTGPKAIRSEHPTVKASAHPTEIADIKTDIPQVEVMASAPAPSEPPTADAPPLARPSPIPAQTYPASERIPEGNGGSNGGGGILGGIMGAVIRGGIGGDGDHCDPRPVPRRTGHPIGGDIYVPNGGNVIGAVMGGMVGARRGRP